MLKNSQWMSDSQVEKALEDLDAKWELRVIKLSDLRVEESKKNNARLGQALDPETVDRYAIAMAGGKAFPAIVSSASGFIFDGNHRVDAAGMNDAVEIMAYVVLNATKKMSEIIIRTFNASHGKPLSSSERIQHAVHLHKECKMSMSDAAKSLNVKYEDVRDAVSVQKIRGLLDAAGEDGSALSQSHVMHLKKFESQPKVLVALAKVVAHHRWNLNELRGMISKVDAQRTEKARLSIVNEWRTKVKGRRDSTSKFPIRDRLFRTFVNPNSIHDFILKGKGKGKSLEAMGIKTEEDRLVLQRNWREFKTHMDGLFSDARKVSSKAKSK